MSTEPGWVVRTARPDETEAVAATLAGAFEHDPAWGGWAFPDPDRRYERALPFWGFFARAALRYDGVSVAPEVGAIAMWVPPGMSEFTEEEEPQFAAMLEQVFGPRAALLSAGFDLFEQARPHDLPCRYLSLLATRPDRAGRGIGMRLLLHGLAEADAAGLAAYLESTNPANLGRYASVGFEPYGSFDLPEGPTVTTMWRPSRTGPA